MMNLSCAFAVTPEDVDLVLRQAGLDVSESQVDRLFVDYVQPQFERIALAALNAEASEDLCLSAQTIAAHAEIASIFKAAGVIPV